jgi:23S rRNA pseudouridine2605 synthase
MEERLQKILSRAGHGSRRGCEELISKGRVTVNGRIAILGMKADPSQDKIAVNGKLIELQEEFKYIALHKPRNVISTTSPQDDRKTVLDIVDEPGQIYPVGRLDFDSEGLILLTNDGDLTYRLTHPKFLHEKEYRILVASKPDEKQITAWRNGVVLEDGYRTKPAKVRVTGTHGKGAWMQVILTEGRKRQIREMGRLTGLPVVRIIRVRIGTLQLGGLKPRQWRHLTPKEISELKGEQGNQPNQGRHTRPTRKPYKKRK